MCAMLDGINYSYAVNLIGLRSQQGGADQLWRGAHFD